MQLCKLEGTFVHAFFLDPNHLGWITLEQVVTDLCHWEGSDLFKSDHLDVIREIASSLLQQSFNVKGHLTRAKDKGFSCPRTTLEFLSQSWLELCANVKLSQLRYRLWMFESDLWRSQNEWFAEVSMHLPPQ